MDGRYVTVDAGRCIGAGQCVMAAPDVFEQDAEGVVVLLAAHPDDDVWADVADAVRRCPVEAITARDI